MPVPQTCLGASDKGRSPAGGRGALLEPSAPLPTLLLLPCRFTAPLLPRLEHHPQPEGAFPHEHDGGAAAAAR